MKRAASIFTILLLSVITARTEIPMQEVKDSIEGVLRILEGTKTQSVFKPDERHQLVLAEMDKRFEWDEIARACLGRHWAERTPAEKAEFIKLFSKFLLERYSGKIMTHYHDLEKIDYQGEQMIDNYWVSVKVVLTSKMKDDYSIEYLLEKAPSGDEWKIYDVVINGVSLVKIYRDQLDAIITESSYDGLFKRIQSKLSALILAASGPG